jgi:ABC-type Fe3+-siderophore transport system permease subunit
VKYSISIYLFNCLFVCLFVRAWFCATIVDKTVASTDSGIQLAATPFVTAMAILAMATQALMIVSMMAMLGLMAPKKIKTEACSCFIYCFAVCLLKL